VLDLLGAAQVVAHAIENGATLVTFDRHFIRVMGLSLVLPKEPTGLLHHPDEQPLDGQHVTQAVGDR
jgi:hypothetical protein